MILGRSLLTLITFTTTNAIRSSAELGSKALYIPDETEQYYYTA